MPTFDKPASPDTPIHAVLTERWSPRAFGPEEVSDADLAALFEAARWAASAMNEQPWRFVVTRRRDAEAHARLGEALVEWNRRWALAAPVLLLIVARTTYTRNDKPNESAIYDVGQAVGQLTAQATALGLRIHQMGGFSAEVAREAVGLPEGYVPLAMAAIGHPGDPAGLPEDLRERELAPRERHPVASFTFDGRWGQPLS